MSDTTSKGKSASELFPGLLQKKPSPRQAETAQSGEQPAGSDAKSDVPSQTGNQPVQPQPPDISWLKSGKLREKAKVSSTPIVIVLVQDEKIKTLITDAMQEFDYQVEYYGSAEEVIARTRHVTPAIIINHADSAESPIEESAFHEYMNWLPMAQRRNIVYVLIAAQFRTLYDLHALSYSANIVVNDQDVKHLAVIIRKGVYDYNSLFGPFTEALHLHAK